MDLAELRVSSRNKSDEASTAGFIGVTELDGYINQGARLIHGKIVQTFNDDFTIPGTALNNGLFNTVVNTQDYNIPTGMKKLVKLECRTSGSTNDNEWRRIGRVNIGSESGYDYYPLREGYAPRFGYFMTKTSIWLRPVPTSVFQVRAWFVPRFTKLTLTTDTPDIPEEYHELISEFAAIQCLRKSGEPLYKEAMDVFNLELANMLSTVEYRDQQPECMTITDESIYEWD